MINLQPDLGAAPAELACHQLGAGFEHACVQHVAQIERDATADDVPQAQRHFRTRGVNDLRFRDRHVRHHALTERGLALDEVEDRGGIDAPNFELRCAIGARLGRDAHPLTRHFHGAFSDGPCGRPLDTDDGVQAGHAVAAAVIDHAGGLEERHVVAGVAFLLRAAARRKRRARRTPRSGACRARC